MALRVYTTINLSITDGQYASSFMLGSTIKSSHTHTNTFISIYMYKHKNMWHLYPLLLCGISELIFVVSCNTLCRDVSCSVNGLRSCRFRTASNDSGLYIWFKYGENPLRPELLGFISESHSCFKLLTAFSPEGDWAGAVVHLWFLRLAPRSKWLPCVCVAASFPCSVDNPFI